MPIFDVIEIALRFWCHALCGRRQIVRILLKYLQMKTYFYTNTV